jgi:site-specific recombinase XerD
MEPDLHKYEIRLHRQIEKVKQEPYCQENKDLILKFVRDLQIDGIKPPKILRYVQTLRKVQEWKDKPFTEWTEDDLKDVVYQIENNNYKIQTINEFRRGLRRFFRWLKGESWEPLKVLRGSRKDNRKPNVLTEEEISRMIEVTPNIRDKAIIAVGYEGGLRIGELAGLTWGHVIWTDWGARIKVHGKTGERVIPLVTGASYLKHWMTYHPHYDPKTNEVDPDSLVFVRINGDKAGQPMSYQMYAKIIKKAALKAGIKKRVYPHIIRHSRATVLANSLTEQQMNVYFGWVQGSNMPAIYVHLSGRDIEGAVLRHNGIVTEEEENHKTQPIKCPRCGEMNTPHARFCHKCGLILDEKERMETLLEESKIMPEVMTKIFEDPKLRDKFKGIMALAESLEGNPKAMEMLTQLIEELGKQELRV